MLDAPQQMSLERHCDVTWLSQQTSPARHMQRHSDLLDTDTETDPDKKTRDQNEETGTDLDRKMEVPSAKFGFALRDYQTSAVESLRSLVASGVRLPLLQAGTGAGKTIIAAEIIRASQAKGCASVFLAHRRELIRQCSDKLTSFDVPHGIIMAGEQPLARATQVVSIQTLAARWNKQLPPTAQLVVIDEAHRATAPTYRKVIDWYRERGAVILGLTATPIRGDGSGLGDVFEQMHCCPSLQDLTADGHLVPARFWAPTEPDLTGIKVSRGDYVAADLAEAMDRPQLTGDIVTHWLRYASDRKTVVFASSVAHSIHLAEQFRSVGIEAAHIDGKTEAEERAAILAALSEGRLQVVTNCEVLTEGWDQPDVSCLVLARPTKSPVMYLQMVGRVLRAHPGKADALILDHAGCVLEHGFPTEFRDWELLPGKAKHPNETQRKREAAGASPITCGECFAVYVGKPHCPECGHKQSKRGGDVSTADGELGELIPGLKPKQPKSRIDEIGRTKFYQECLGYAQAKGFKPGWAAHKYREATGDFPNGIAKVAKDPSAQTISYLRHLNIKRAKAA